MKSKPKEKNIYRNHKSSANYISGIIHKPPHSEVNEKGSILISKIKKPSVNDYQKYLKSYKRPKPSLDLSLSDEDDWDSNDNHYNEKDLLTDFNTEIGKVIYKITKISEEYKTRPIIKIREAYKQAKKAIIFDHSEIEAQKQKYFEKLSFENKLLKDKWQGVNEFETSEVSLILPESNEIFDSAEGFIEKWATKKTKTELSVAVAEELSNFQTGKVFADLEKINNQITSFFGSNELQIFYSDLVVALCKKIFEESERHQRVKSETEKIRKKHQELIFNL